MMEALKVMVKHIILRKHDEDDQAEVEVNPSWLRQYPERDSATLLVRSSCGLLCITQEILGKVQEVANEAKGSPAVFECVEAARDYLSSEDFSTRPAEEAMPTSEAGADPCADLFDAESVEIDYDYLREVSKEASLKTAQLRASLREEGSAHSRREGRMCFGDGLTVGLVGKPSCGKSTFFNKAKAEPRARQRPGRTRL